MLKGITVVNTLIIIAVGFFVVLMILFAVLRKVFKYFFIVILILMAVSGYFGWIIFQDAMDLKEKMPTSDILYVLEDDGTAISAMAFSAQNPEPSFLVSEELVNLTYDPKSVSNTNYYKYFVIDIALIENNTQSIVFEQVALTPEQVTSLIQSPTPVLDFANLMIPDDYPSEYRQVAIDQITDQIIDEQLKAMLFAASLQETMPQGGVQELLTSYRDGKINIYPETPVFKFIKKVPQFVIDEAIKSMEDEE
ncbi:hypothetical protein GOV04_02805 [Candidatus Woesearchaeota archaeon]|nr:hypothetical protein [Candidatus Woesearchaeota archaeon]